MLFHQPRTEDADTQMEAMTVELIDAAIPVRWTVLPSLQIACDDRTVPQCLPSSETVLYIKKDL